LAATASWIDQKGYEAITYQIVLDITQSRKELRPRGSAKALNHASDKSFLVKNVSWLPIRSMNRFRRPAKDSTTTICRL